MTTDSAPEGASGEHDPTRGESIPTLPVLAATAGQLALRDELLKLRAHGPTDCQRPLTLQTLDGAPRYKAGRATGFYATLQGTPPVVEILVREGEGNDTLIDLASGGGKWHRVSLQYGSGGVIAKKYRDLAWACWEVLQELKGVQEPKGKTL